MTIATGSSNLSCQRRLQFIHRGFPLLAVLAVLLPPVFGCRSGGLGRGDTVTFFPTAAHRDTQGNWLVPINGWVCEPRLNDWTFRLMKRRFELNEFVESPEQRAILRERADQFIVDNKTGRRIDILVAGHQVRLAESGDMGLIEDRVVVPGDAAAAASAPAARSNWITYRTVAKRNGKPFEGQVQLLEPTGLSVISDIDDTIRITEVNNTKTMIRRSFLEPFEAVPGMPATYRYWAQAYGAEFHYVSASAHQLYEPLADLIDDAYPPGSVTLRAVKRDGSTLKYLVDMMDAPPEWKLEKIGRLLRNFPRRKFVLVGDSGQHDPEVYAELARSYPGQIQRILIRDVTCEDADAERYQRTFEGLPASLWQIFRDPVEIRDAIFEDERPAVADRETGAGR